MNSKKGLEVKALGPGLMRYLHRDSHHPQQPAGCRVWEAGRRVAFQSAVWKSYGGGRDNTNAFVKEKAVPAGEISESDRQIKAVAE